MDRVEQIGSSMEHIIQVVNTLTNIIVTNSPELVSMFSPLSQNFSPKGYGEKNPTSPIVDLTKGENQLDRSNAQKKISRKLFTSNSPI